MGVCGPDSTGSGLEPIVGSCKYGAKSSVA